MTRIDKNELRVFYNLSERISRELDEDIEVALKKHGYTRYASGFYFADHVRDLAFERKK